MGSTGGQPFYAHSPFLFPHPLFLLQQALDDLYSALDRCEDILARQRFLVGNTITEADIRLFVSLIRFDEVSCAENTAVDQLYSGFCALVCVQYCV